MPWNELINSTSTIAGTAIGAQLGTSIGVALHNPNAGMALSMGLGLAGGYLGNLVYNKPSPDRVRDKVHRRVVTALTAHGMTPQQIEEAFATYHPSEPLPSPGVVKNIGNVIATNTSCSLFSPMGELATTALCTTLGKGIDHLMGGGNRVASYGFVAGMLGGQLIGKLGGAYLGNKLFSGPSKDYVQHEERTFVQRVLEQRHMTMPEAQHAK